MIYNVIKNRQYYNILKKLSEELFIAICPRQTSINMFLWVIQCAKKWLFLKLHSETNYHWENRARGMRERKEKGKFRKVKG
jgi:hypothetical protein